MTTETVTRQNSPALKLEDAVGKYLTFRLGGQSYGLTILHVQEIIRSTEVSALPRTPDFVRGVINLRGAVIPVIELSLKFGLEPEPDTETTCIVVMQLVTEDGDVTIGVIVDEVSEVMDIEAEQIDPPPVLGMGSGADILVGIGKIEDKVIMLLSMKKVLLNNDIAIASQIQRDASLDKE